MIISKELLNKLLYFMNLFIYLMFNILLQYVHYINIIYCAFNFWFFLIYILGITYILYHFNINKYLLLRNLYLINFLIINIYILDFNDIDLFFNYINCYIYYLFIHIIWNIIYLIIFFKFFDGFKIFHISGFSIKDWTYLLKTQYLLSLIYFNRLLFFELFKKDKAMEYNGPKELIVSNDSLFYYYVYYYISNKKWKWQFFVSIFLYFLEIYIFKDKIIYSKTNDIKQQEPLLMIISYIINYIRNNRLHLFIIKNIFRFFFIYFNIKMDISNLLYLAILENLPVFIAFSGFVFSMYCYNAYKKWRAEKAAEAEDIEFTEFTEVREVDVKMYESDANLSTLDLKKVIRYRKRKKNLKYIKKFTRIHNFKQKASKKLEKGVFLYPYKKGYPFYNEVYKKYYNILYYKERVQTLNYLNAYHLGSFEEQLQHIYDMYTGESNIYCLRSLYDEFIKSYLDNPFTDERIPFTFFNFAENKIDEEKLKEFSILISYLVFFKNKKPSTIDANYQSFKNSFISFYLKKLNQNSVLNLTYYNQLIKPLNILENINFSESFKIYVNDIEKNNIDDIKTLIKNTFLEIHSNVTEPKRFNRLINIADVEVLNKKKFIRFLDAFKNLNKTELSESLTDYNLSDKLKNWTFKEEQLLNLFSDENLFYLDYISLMYNYNKFSLCYLVFVYRVLKMRIEYDNYVKFEQVNFMYTYYNVITRYHSQMYKRFDYLNKTLKYFILNKSVKNSSDYSFSNLTNDIKFINNRNSLSYFKALQTTFMREDLIESRKTNYYDAYLYFFERYKDIIDNPYSKSNLNIPNIKTFDNFVYDSCELNQELDFSELEKRKNNLKFLCSKYKFDLNGNWINFDDIGFFYYDFEPFKDTKNDIFLFFDLRKSEFLQFKKNNDNIDNIILNEKDNITLNEKQDFQYNYCLIYYNYIIKLLLNRKTCFSNMFIENLLYENKDFYFQNLDVFDIEKLDNFNYFLSNFLNGFRYCVINKRKNLFDLIYNLSEKYPRFLEKLQSLNLNLMYDPELLNNLTLEDIFNIEILVNELHTGLNENILKIYNLREKYVNWINVFDINKLDEFFDFSLFKDIEGLKRLKHYYFIILQELIEEERLFDHLLNITSCCFRIFDNHYKYWRYEVLLKKGIFPNTPLKIEDWNYIFNEIEPNNPLIYILLYNSKAKKMAKGTKIPILWSPLIKFKDIIEELSDCSERTWCYESDLHDEWVAFYELNKKRKIINYSLTVNQVMSLKSMLIEYLHFSYEKIDINQFFHIALNELNLQYSSIDDLYVYVKKEKPTMTKVLVENLKKEFKPKIKVEESSHISYDLNFYINFDIDYNFIKYYENISLKIKDKDISQFFNNKWKDIKFLYYNITGDLEKFNTFIKLTKSTYLLNNTYLICNNFKINKEILLNIIKSYNTVTFETENLLFNKVKAIKNLDFLLDSKNFFQLSYNLNMQFYIDSYIYTFFFDVSKMFDNLYNNEFLINLKNKINTLNYQTIAIIEDLNYNNMNLQYVFSLVYNSYYNSYFYASFMLYRIQYLNKIINDFFYLLKADDLNQILLIKHLLKDLKKDKNDDIVFFFNLLINFKDPVLLLNYLNLDYKLFLEYLFSLRNIIENPDFNKDAYQKHLATYKLNKTFDPKYDIYTIDTFFSLYKKEKLKSCVTILYNYIDNNSYFNLSKLDLDKLNLSNVLDLSTFKDWFNIENLKKSNFSLVNDSDLKFFSYDILIKIPEDRINSFQNLLEVKNICLHIESIPKFRSLYKKKVHVEKIKSMPILKWEKEKSLQIEENKGERTFVQMTDNEKVGVDEDDVTLLLKNAEEKLRVEKKKKYLEKKMDRMFSSFTVYREWGYKVECISCYLECKKKFDLVLSDMNHKIWDDVRAIFKKDYRKFAKFIKCLNNDEKQKLFNVIWNKALDKLIKKKQAIHDNWTSDKWPLLLEAVNRTQSDIITSYGEEFYNWKISWNNRNWYLDLNYKNLDLLNEFSVVDEHYLYKEQEGIDAYTNNKVYKHQHRRLIGNKKAEKEKLINWWHVNDWWKYF